MTWQQLKVLWCLKLMSSSSFKTIIHLWNSFNKHHSLHSQPQNSVTLGHNPFLVLHLQKNCQSVFILPHYFFFFFFATLFLIYFSVPFSLLLNPTCFLEYCKELQNSHFLCHSLPATRPQCKAKALIISPCRSLRRFHRYLQTI